MAWEERCLCRRQEDAANDKGRTSPEPAAALREKKEDEERLKVSVVPVG